MFLVYFLFYIYLYSFFVFVFIILYTAHIIWQYLIYNFKNSSLLSYTINDILFIHICYYIALKFSLGYPIVLHAEVYTILKCARPEDKNQQSKWMNTNFKVFKIQHKMSITLFLFKSNRTSHLTFSFEDTDVKQ